MKKRDLFAVIVIVALFVLSAAYSSGAVKSEESKQLSAPKTEPPQAVVSKDQPKDKEKTKEEMLAELKEDLADNDEVFDALPELKTGTDRNGNAVYTYKNTALNELSKEDLTNLYDRVRQALVKIRTDRIQRQLETINQVERLQRMANTPQPPRIPAQAQPSRIPATQPSVSRTPPSPPPAPQRR
jgi:uncharacterized phage infection (PIP) family protein YhgE